MEDSELSSCSSSTPATTSPKRRKRVRIRNKAPPPLPSNSHRCLICLGTCTLSTSPINGGGKIEDGGTSLNIPGSNGSEYLNRQLEQMFILRKLLEMPFSWCHETLQELTEKVLEKQDKLKDPTDKPQEEHKNKKEDDGQSEDLNEWFNLCAKCFKKWVHPGWEIYQKILTLEGQLNIIKQTVRNTMKEKILQRKRNRKWSGLTGSGMDVKVRKWIFPDLIVMKAGGMEEEAIQPRARPRPSYQTTEQEMKTPDDPQDDDFNDDLGQGQDPDYPSPCPSPPPSPPILEEESPSKKIKASPTTKNGTGAPRRKRIRIRKPKSSSSTTPTKTAGAPPKKRIRIRKPRRKFEDLKKFKCLLCSSYFPTYEDLNKHLKLHEEPEKYHVCSRCTFPALNQLDLELHIKNRHERKKLRKCTWPLCTFTCRSHVRLDKHLLEVHQDGDSSTVGVEGFNCENCGRTFSNRSAFLIHQKKSHPELFGAELEIPVECDQCGEKFISRILLGYHVNRVHRFVGPLRYQCDECGKGFNERKALDRHLITHVNGTKRDWVCDICGVDYAYKSLLTEHYKKVHGGGAGGGGKVEGGGGVEGVEVFKCKYCEMTSPFKVVIDRHLREHKEEMGNRCRKCGRCYVSESGLKRHMRLNHAKEKISVECPWCRKGFPSRDYMRMHERLYCKLKGVGGGADGGGGGVGGEGIGVDVKLGLG